MLAKKLISEVIPPLFPSEKGLIALNWMEIFRISHMAVIDSRKELVGIISDNYIYDNNISDKIIGDSSVPFGGVFVYDDEHIYKVINLFSVNKLTSLPVLNRNNKYLGVISLQDLVLSLSELFSTNEMGAVFVIEMSSSDYSLTRIANIVEENNAKILNLYVKSNNLSTKINVIIKVDVVDIGAIRQGLERYDYFIKETYSNEDKLSKMLYDRYDEFISYLNI